MISNVEFWIQLSNRLIEVELLVGDHPQQRAVLTEVRRDLERFKDWIMADSEVAQLMEQLEGVLLPCQHSQGYHLDAGGMKTRCNRCGEELEL